MNLYYVYTDGACSGNPGPGGWAALILDSGKKLLQEISGFEPATTNNRMEILAAIRGIEATLALDPKPQIILCSDSSYLVNTYTKGWMATWLRTNWNKGAIKNQDLWQELNSLLAKVQIKWFWVKGHAVNEYNNRCDQLAVEQIKQHTEATGQLGVQGPSAVGGRSENSLRINDAGPSVKQVKLPPFDPATLNNPASRKASENRCLVSLAELAANAAKIQQVAGKYGYQEIKQRVAPNAIGSITGCVVQATFGHPSRPVHPFFLQVGDMADFWLCRNAEKANPLPAPSRSDLVKLICAFIVTTGVEKARQLGLET